MKVFWGRCGDGASSDVGDEARAKEDGEDGEVLVVVIDGYSVVTCTERVLDACAQIMRERHQGEEMSRHVYLVLVGQLYFRDY